MTTKKQRREQTAAKTAERREADRLHGLEMQRIDREKHERRLYDAQRAENRKATALKMRKQHEASKAKEELPENMQASIEKIMPGFVRLDFGDAQDQMLNQAFGLDVGAEEKY